ncbi:hypothetical protein LCGC14_0830730 [marine sediment metagenome]|uniref:Uncharacterized protein n=1 Tax=marine sediment metagenome TaxID=412755 RepID=A0A0F9SNA8_9ZZZZ
MVDSILKLLRGSTRPLALVAFIAANLGLLYLGVFMEGAREYIFQAVAIIEGPTLLVLGFWFAERKRPEPLADPDGLKPPPDIAL